MHSDSRLMLLERLNSISSFTASYDHDREALVDEIKGALEVLGVSDFVALTVNNLSLIQRSASSFVCGDRFFGQHLSALITSELLTRCDVLTGPVFVEGAHYVKGALDDIRTHNNCSRHIGIFSMFRTRFLFGVLVVFAQDAEVLKRMAWEINTVASAAVDAVTRLRPPATEDTKLTDEEIATLRWTYEGMTAREVADVLGVPVRRVNYWLNSAMKKLNSKNKAQASKTAKEMSLF